MSARRIFFIAGLMLVAIAIGLGLDDTVMAAIRPGGGGGFSGGGGGGFSGGGGGFSGGGSGFSGGSSWSSSSSSGGGGGGGDLGMFGLVIALAFVFIPVFIGMAEASESSGWDSFDGDIDYGDFATTAYMPPKPVSLAALKEHDPNFSQIILEDFLFELYTRAQESRGSEEDLALLSPYLDEGVRKELYSRRGRSVLAVSGVIVGAMRVSDFSTKQGWASLEVTYETNFTEVYPSEQGKGQLGFYSKERWHFVRKLAAQSRKPDELRGFNCPSCGAPVKEAQHDECEHCGVTHGTGDFDWLCNGIQIQREETRGPALTSNAVEVGTLSRTRVANDLQKRLAELKAHDPAFDRDEFFARVELVFHELNEAWSSLSWDDARPFLSDRLWLSWRYWIHAYEEQNLHNKLEGARITRRELVKVDADPFFHSVTVRFWASGRDYTVHRKTGALVCGQPGFDRHYSEYWTFIRSATRKGKAHADKNCPSCGAGLSINMAGNCEFCSVKITGGSFDWVLSKVEQDESYLG